MQKSVSAEELIIPTEHQEQACFVEYCEWKGKSDERYLNIFAVPNGGFRTKTGATKLKREGTKAGVPDIIVAYPMFAYEDGYRVIVYGGAGIEFKRKGGRTSLEQKQWALRLRKANWSILEKATADEAIKFIDDWFRVR